MPGERAPGFDVPTSEIAHEFHSGVARVRACIVSLKMHPNLDRHVMVELERAMDGVAARGTNLADIALRNTER